MPLLVIHVILDVKVCYMVVSELYFFGRTTETFVQQTFVPIKIIQLDSIIEFVMNISIG